MSSEVRKTPLDELPLEQHYSILLRDLAAAIEADNESKANSVLGDLQTLIGYGIAGEDSVNMYNEDRYPGLADINNFMGDIMGDWREIDVLQDFVSLEDDETMMEVVDQTPLLEPGEEPVEEESGSELSFADLYRQTNDLLGTVNTVDDIETIQQNIIALREMVDLESIRVFDDRDLLPNIGVMTTALKGLESRAEKAFDRLPSIQMMEIIADVREMLTQENAHLFLAENISLLEGYFQSHEDYFNDPARRDVKEQYDVLYTQLQEEYSVYKEAITEELTQWVTQIESETVVQEVLNIVEVASTDVLSFDEVADNLNQLTARIDAFSQIIEASFSDVAELRALQEVYAADVYVQVETVKTRLEKIQQTPQVLKDLIQNNDKLRENIQQAEFDDTFSFDIQRSIFDLERFVRALQDEIEQDHISQNYRSQADKQLQIASRLVNRAHKLEDVAERKELHDFLLQPEIARINDLVSKISQIKREDILPHARATRRHTYSSEELTQFLDDLNNALQQAKQSNAFDVVGSSDLVQRAQKIEDAAYRYIDVLQQFIDYSNTEPDKERPHKMKVKAIVDELMTITFSQDPRVNQLKNEFLNKIGGVSNNKLANYYRLRVGIQEVSVIGDPGKKDFGVYFDAIMPTLSGKYVSFLGIARALLLNPTTAERGTVILTPEQRQAILNEENEKLEIHYTDMNQAEVDDEMIRIWDYILVRIKGKYANNSERRLAGLFDPKTEAVDPKYDRTKPFDQWSAKEKKEFATEFDYNNLSEDGVDAFMEHLEKEFPASLVDRDKMLEMVKYAQNMAIKSAGYVPWLLGETTRAHGGTSALLEKKDFSDELFALAPFAAGFYSRGRYAFIEANATSGDLLFIPRDVAVALVDNHFKQHETGDLWELIDTYADAKWRGIPKWVSDVRNMIQRGSTGDGAKWDEETLNINENWMPMPGEVAINIIRVERAKREFLSAHLNPSDAQKKAFAQPFINMGYGKSFDDLGIPKLSQIDQGQYKLAFDATDKMFSTFREEPEWINKQHDVIAKFRKWLSSIIGKSKLIPGKHQLLFAPYTVMMMDRLNRSYIGGGDKYEADELRREFIKELLGAGGVPKFVKVQVLQYLDWDQSSIDKVFKYSQIAQPTEEEPENTEEFVLPSFLRKKKEKVDLDTFEGLPDKRIQWMIPYETIAQEKYKKKLYKHRTKSNRRPSTKIRRILPLAIGKKDDGVSVIFEPPYEHDHVDRDTTKR